MVSVAVPRSGQSPRLAGMSLRSRPVVRHSLVDVVDFRELAMSGTATPRMRKENTVAAYPVKVEVSASTPDFLVSSGQPARMLHYPPKFLRSSAKAKYRKKRDTVKMASCITDEELLDEVAKRLERGFTGFRTMFRAFDSKGDESISKDALLKVLYNNVGYISPEQYEGFLKSMGLEHKPLISFDLFVSRFKDRGNISELWTDPVKRDVMAETMRRAHPEEELRSARITELNKYTTAAHANTLLYNAIRRGNVDIRSLLPEACFLPNGMVLKPQLREALSEIGVHLDDKQFGFFWDRYDKEKIGAVPTKELYTLLDLKPDGTPWDISVPRNTQDYFRQSVPHYKTEDAAPHRKRQIQAEAAQRSLKLEGVRGQAIKTPSSAAAEEGEEEGEEEGKEQENPIAEANKRRQIREVMQEHRGQGKFGSIIDCLFYKFEWRYQSLLMAFKLFDIADDGHVMRVDFRRVLAEFGFPLTALMLGAFLNKLSTHLRHGRIDYQMLMKKLMTLTDPLVADVLDAKIKSLVDGSGTASDDTATRLVEFLHSDYASFAASLLHADKNKRYVLAVEDVKAAIESCLTYSMTDRQLEDLQQQLPLDDRGNVKYIDFLKVFERDPGTWNQVTQGGVSVSKQRVVVTPPPELTRLQRCVTDVAPARQRTLPKMRDAQQLREELRTFFDKHLFDFDERYSKLDRKSHNRFSKWQFGSLLRLCGFPITDSELKHVWETLSLGDDNMSTYSGVIMEFAPGHTSFKEQLKRPGEGEDTSCAEKEGNSQWLAPTQDVEQEAGTDAPFPDLPQLPDLPDPPAHSQITTLFCRLQPFVSHNLEFLHASFQNMDPHGFGTVSFPQMQRVIDSLKSGIKSGERNKICDQFDFRKTGRCSYLAFMKAFAKPQDGKSKWCFSPDRFHLERKPSGVDKPLTVSEALLRIRTKLIKHWKNLRRAFQHSDHSRTGYMSVADFKKVLKKCDVPVSDEDLYHILSECDQDMDGKICYQEFLSTLIRV